MVTLCAEPKDASLLFRKITHCASIGLFVSITVITNNLKHICGDAKTRGTQEVNYECYSSTVLPPYLRDELCRRRR